MSDRSQLPDRRVRKVFDASEWADAGYDQPGGNEQFWHPARILSEIDGSGLRPDGSRERIATVEWLHNGRVSAGHFLHMMREVESAPEADEEGRSDG